MGAIDLQLEPYSEERLNPFVVIVSSAPENYMVFSALLDDQGFPTQLLSNVEDMFTAVQAREGMVVFIDWELPNSNVKSVTEMLTQNLGADVIVYSNSDDVKSRAELASCGFSKTIQPPYNEKNFLMAMQKIKSDRHAENEKILRKMNHQNRMQAANGPAVVTPEANLEQVGEAHAPEGSNHFSGAPAPTSQSDQFTGPGFDGGHQMHQGQADDGFQLVGSGESAPTGHSHFSGEVPPELAALAEAEESEEWSAVQEGAQDSDMSFAQEAAPDMNLTSSEGNLVDHLVGQLDDAEEEESSLAPEEEVVEEFQSMGGLSASLKEEFEAVDSQRESWKDVQLPELPKVGDGPLTYPPGQAGFSRMEPPGSFSARDWILMVSGIVIMLAMCSYFLAQVFLIPFLNQFQIF